MSVDLEIAGGIAHIVLNRPDKLNAINGAMTDALEASLDAAAKRDDLRAVRLTKQAIKRGAEIGGLRRALANGLEVDMRIETTETPESCGFNAILEKEGLKAALDWRASRNAGQ